jgi:hypothetical protein
MYNSTDELLDVRGTVFLQVEEGVFVEVYLPGPLECCRCGKLATTV